MLEVDEDIRMSGHERLMIAFIAKHIDCNPQQSKCLIECHLVCIDDQIYWKLLEDFKNKGVVVIMLIVIK